MQKTKIEEQYKLQKKELEQNISKLRQKEKEQMAIKKNLTACQSKIKGLEGEIERMKTAKVTLMKKLKEENDNFQKWKKQRQNELLALKRQIMKKDRENDQLKRDNKRKEIVAKRKQEELSALQNRARLDQQKKTNATKMRQQNKRVDTAKIKSWILENTEKMLQYRGL